MNADAIDGLVRVAGAVVLLSSFKMGRRRGSRRARHSHAQRAARGGLSESPANSKTLPIPPDPVRELSRYRIRLGNLLTGLGITLLLFGLGYLALQGEVVLMGLDDALGPFAGD